MLSPDEHAEQASRYLSQAEETLGGLCPSCGGGQLDHVDNVTEGDHGEDINGWLCLMDELDQVLFDMETAEPPAEPGWLQIVAAVRDAYRHRLASGAVPSTGEVDAAWPVGGTVPFSNGPSILDDDGDTRRFIAQAPSIDWDRADDGTVRCRVCGIRPAHGEATDAG